MPVSHQMTSNLERTSAILGEYMLKGWTLTDLHCDTCHATPLMREPTRSAQSANRSPIQFCALCDGNPNSVLASSSPSPSTTNTASQAPQAGPSIASRNSSDRAASEISALLLQGYSLLNENCSEPSCVTQGIPLVGYPRKKDGSKDSRRLCVLCGGRWVTEGDLGGMKIMDSRAGSSVGAGARGGGADEERRAGLGVEERGGESPRSRKRRELYAEGEIVQAEIERVRADEERVRSRPELIRDLHEGEEDEEMDIQEDEVESKSVGRKDLPTGPHPNIQTALSKTQSSLTQTLTRLSTSLDTLNDKPASVAEARYFVDVKLHTEAIKDVLEVLRAVREFGA